MAPRDIVAAHYAAMADGDLPRALADFADDLRWTESAGSAYAGTFVGRDEIVAGVFARIGADWDGFAAIPSDIIGDGDVVAVLGTYRGVHTASGTPLEARFTHIWRIRDGRIVEFEQVVDSALLNAAMVAAA